MLCCVVFCCVVCYAMLCYVVLRCVVLCCVMLYYVVLCCVCEVLYCLTCCVCALNVCVYVCMCVCVCICMCICVVRQDVDGAMLFDMQRGEVREVFDERTVMGRMCVNILYTHCVMCVVVLCRSCTFRHTCTTYTMYVICVSVCSFGGFTSMFR